VVVNFKEILQSAEKNLISFNHLTLILIFILEFIFIIALTNTDTLKVMRLNLIIICNNYDIIFDYHFITLS